MKEFTMMQKTGLQIYHFFRGWVNLKFAQAYCMAYCNIYTWYKVFQYYQNQVSKV